MVRPVGSEALCWFSEHPDREIKILCTIWYLFHPCSLPLYSRETKYLTCHEAVPLGVCCVEHITYQLWTVVSWHAHCRQRCLQFVFTRHSSFLGLLTQVSLTAMNSSWHLSSCWNLWLLSTKTNQTPLSCSLRNSYCTVGVPSSSTSPCSFMVYV